MQYIISDIHGCFYTLKKLIDRIKDLDSKASFVFVGDYTDRGKNSKEVVEYMITMQNEGAICLRGNHDDVMDWFLNNRHCLGHMTEYVSGVPTFQNMVPWWQWNGFEETLDSYGVVSHMRQVGMYSSGGGDPLVVAEEFIRIVPKSHKDFFLDLPLYWENDTHFACHAYVRYNEELPRDFKFMPADRADEALWSRFREGGIANLKTKWDKIGVFGHTPVKNYGSPVPMKIDKIRLIDTGAVLDGYLCGYICETDDWILQATDSRDIKESREKK